MAAIHLSGRTTVAATRRSYGRWILTNNGK